MLKQNTGRDSLPGAEGRNLKKGFHFHHNIFLKHPSIRSASKRGRDHSKTRLKAHALYSGGLSRDLDVNSVEFKDSSASCHQ
ncbi:hypothetical protein GQ457_14G014540 [Hibiscus cannabinus]